MQLPAIHLNGSGKNNLIEEAGDCYLAIVKALDVVSSRPPNARDYYVISGEAYNLALAEHQDRIKRLHALGREFEALCEGIQNGGWRG
jgi:hypothetical protein